MLLFYAFQKWIKDTQIQWDVTGPFNNFFYFPVSTTMVSERIWNDVTPLKAMVELRTLWNWRTGYEMFSPNSLTLKISFFLALRGNVQSGCSQTICPKCFFFVSGLFLLKGRESCFLNHKSQGLLNKTKSIIQFLSGKISPVLIKLEENRQTEIP